MVASLLLSNCQINTEFNVLMYVSNLNMNEFKAKCQDYITREIVNTCVLLPNYGTSPNK